MIDVIKGVARGCSKILWWVEWYSDQQYLPINRMAGLSE